ncbi:Ferric reduction oxidase 2 [Diplonema papillatum]|nr:Ferric reduction oxidase 2 [Diplonema papillatum]|eukprot:gene4174-6478_t
MGAQRHALATAALCLALVRGAAAGVAGTLQFTDDFSIELQVLDDANLTIHLTCGDGQWCGVGFTTDGGAGGDEYMLNSDVIICNYSDPSVTCVDSFVDAVRFPSPDPQNDVVVVGSSELVNGVWSATWTRTINTTDTDNDININPQLSFIWATGAFNESDGQFLQHGQMDHFLITNFEPLPVTPMEGRKQLTGEYRVSISVDTSHVTVRMTCAADQWCGFGTTLSGGNGSEYMLDSAVVICKIESSAISCRESSIGDERIVSSDPQNTVEVLEWSQPSEGVWSVAWTRPLDTSDAYDQLYSVRREFTERMAFIWGTGELEANGNIKQHSDRGHLVPEDLEPPPLMSVGVLHVTEAYYIEVEVDEWNITVSLTCAEDQWCGFGASTGSGSDFMLSSDVVICRVLSSEVTCSDYSISETRDRTPDAQNDVFLVEAGQVSDGKWTAKWTRALVTTDDTDIKITGREVFIAATGPVSATTDDLLQHDSPGGRMYFTLDELVTPAHGGMQFSQEFIMNLDIDVTNITVWLTCADDQWCAVGPTLNDVVVCRMGDLGVTCTDSSINDTGDVSEDAQNDAFVLESTAAANGIWTVKWTRLLKTDDAADFSIRGNETFTWVTGTFRGDGSLANDHQKGNFNLSEMQAPNPRVFLVEMPIVGSLWLVGDYKLSNLSIVSTNLTVSLTCGKDQWCALGVSPDGGAGGDEFMLNNDVVVCRVDSSQVVCIDSFVSQDRFAGPVPDERDDVVVLDAQISGDGQWSVTWTRALASTDEKDHTITGEEAFIWATGAANPATGALSQHASPTDRGHFQFADLVKPVRGGLNFTEEYAMNLEIDVTNITVWLTCAENRWCAVGVGGNGFEYMLRSDVVVCKMGDLGATCADSSIGDTRSVSEDVQNDVFVIESTTVDGGVWTVRWTRLLKTDDATDFSIFGNETFIWASGTLDTNGELVYHDDQKNHFELSELQDSIPTPAPDTLAPETVAPTRAPPTLAPETAVPETLAPPTLAPTVVPATLAPPTLAPTSAPPTDAPPTLSPGDTHPPRTQAPETNAPPTLPPNTLAPETQVPSIAPDTNAPPTLAPNTTHPPRTFVPTTAPATLAPGATHPPQTASPDTIAPLTPAPETDAPDAMTHSRVFSDGYSIEWALSDTELIVTMKCATGQWCGLGFSDDRKMPGADTIACWLGEFEAKCFDGSVGSTKTRPTADAIDNVNVRSSKETDGSFSILFSRPRVTGDARDTDIVDGQQGIIWATGPVVNDVIQFHAANKGGALINWSAPQTPAPVPQTPAPPLLVTSRVFNDDYRIEWELLETELVVSMTCAIGRWCGLGFSDTQEMPGADTIACWILESAPFCYDGSVGDVKQKPATDATQNVEVRSFTQTADAFTIEFARPRKGDATNKAVVQGSQGVVWATGEVSPDGDMVYHGNSSRGGVQIDWTGAVPMTVTPLGDSGWIRIDDSMSARFEFISSSTGSTKREGEALQTNAGDYVSLQMSYTCQKGRYCALGLNDDGKMTPSDVFICWENVDGTVSCSDWYCTSEDVCPADPSQDIRVEASTSGPTSWSVVFSRALNTGDPRDHVIPTDTVNFIWATGDASGSSPTTEHDSDGAAVLDVATGTLAVTTGADKTVWHIIVAICLLLGLGLVSGIIIAVRPRLGYFFQQSYVGAALSIFLIIAAFVVIAVGDAQHYEDRVGQAAVPFGGVAQLAIALALVLKLKMFSPVLFLMSCPQERALVWHRWIGRFGWLCVTLHFIIMCAKYSEEPQGAGVLFDMDLTSSTTDGQTSVNPVFGFIAWILYTLLVLLGIPMLRRLYYSVFLVSHIVLSLGTLICTIVHLPKGWRSYVIFGLPVIMSVVDNLLRIIRHTHAGQIEHIENIETVTKIVVRLSGAQASWGPGSYFYVSIPKVAFMEAHPFSVTSHHTSGKATFYIKNMGPGTFTDRLSKTANDSKSELAVRMEGPYGKLSFDMDAHDKLILVCGGIGITPMLSTIEYMDAKKTATLVWLVRDPKFVGMMQPVFEEMSSRLLQLRVLIFYTGSGSFGRGAETSDRYVVTAGRPDLSDILGRFADARSAVSVCGPAGLTTLACATVKSSALNIPVHTETFEF